MIHRRAGCASAQSCTLGQRRRHRYRSLVRSSSCLTQQQAEDGHIGRRVLYAVMILRVCIYFEVYDMYVSYIPTQKRSSKNGKRNVRSFVFSSASLHLSAVSNQHELLIAIPGYVSIPPSHSIPSLTKGVVEVAVPALALERIATLVVPSSPTAHPGRCLGHPTRHHPRSRATSAAATATTTAAAASRSGSST